MLRAQGSHDASRHQSFHDASRHPSFNDASRHTRLEVIGSAAAGIAHDINNQLTLILNHLDSPGPGPTQIQQVKNAALRCSSLTSSLLTWARGGVTAARAIDPAEFITNFLAHVSIPDGIELLTSIAPGLPPITADPPELDRVLHNLVSNACAAMLSAHGSGILRINATPLAIEISDSGPGVAPELRGQIFEPFFTTKGTDGTGLGLAIVREIMRRFGGSVVVQSAPSGGACFQLRFRQAKG